MARKRTSPAKKLFRVYADDVQRVFQDIEANSAKQAHKRAGERRDYWDSCDEHDSNGIRVSGEVEDIATGEFIRVDYMQTCRTCESDIVESHFRDGECGPCEYRRYRSQQALLTACESLCGLLYRDKNDREQIDMEDYERAEKVGRRAIKAARNAA